MWMTATLNAYDVMGQVHVTLSVSALTPEGATPTTPVLRCATTFDGVGETDSREWLRDVLVAALETL